MTPPPQGPVPSPMPTPDLAGLLRRPRSSGTTKDAARPNGNPPDTPTQVPSTTPTPSPDQTPRRDRQPDKPPAASATPVPSPPGRQYLRSIAVYLPRSLHQQLRAAATHQETTATALILAAVNTTHDRLGAALAKQAAAHRTTDGDLFDVPQARRAAEPTAQTTIRVTDRQYRALTELSATLQVKRSQLLTTAVRLYLTT